MSEITHEPDADAVAQPGWPTPGELASTFDPDAFDPLPEAEETAGGELDADQPTGVIEIREGIETPVAAESAEWEDDFDPATGWGDEHASGSHEDLPAALWKPDDPNADEVPSSAGADELWHEPGEEPAWSSSPELELTADDGSDALLLETSTPVDGSDEPAESSSGMMEVLDDPAGAAWSHDEAAAWLADDEHDAPGLAVPLPIPGDVREHTGAPVVSFPAAGSGGQVLLDIAGLAASGRSIELVIEPNDGGRGVRVRIGDPVALPERVGDAAAIATDQWGESVLAAAPHAASRVPFLEGEVGIEPDTHEIGNEWIGLVVGTVGTESTTTDRPSSEELGSWQKGPMSAPEAGEPLGELSAPTADGDPPASGATVVDQGDDDPARILADIRARLAALDAGR